MYCEARFRQHYESNEDAAVVRKFGKTMENLRKQCNVRTSDSRKETIKINLKTNLY